MRLERCAFCRLHGVNGARSLNAHSRHRSRNTGSKLLATPTWHGGTTRAAGATLLRINRNSQLATYGVC